MGPLRHFALLLFLFSVVAIVSSVLALHAQNGDAVMPEIPKTWVDEEIATLEVPLADPIGSPKHVSADYYYRVPVRPIYKSYAVYAPGHEPPGYLDWLKQQEPEVNAKGAYSLPRNWFERVYQYSSEDSWTQGPRPVQVFQ